MDEKDLSVSYKLYQGSANDSTTLPSIRAKKERQKAIDKACKQIYALSKDAKPINHGVAKYIKKVPFDSKTGEYAEDTEYRVFLNGEKIDKNERLDGY